MRPNLCESCAHWAGIGCVEGHKNTPRTMCDSYEGIPHGCPQCDEASGRLRQVVRDLAEAGIEHPHTVEAVRQLIRERDEANIRWKSLLTELWDGVRIHGLQAPTRGRDGERLIHAYCGGIVKERNERDQLREAARMAYECLLGDTDYSAWHSEHCYKTIVERGGEDACVCGLTEARAILRRMWDTKGAGDDH